METNTFPWDKPIKDAEDVRSFLNLYRNKLKQNQIELLEHFCNKIYGFYIKSDKQESALSTMDPHKKLHTTIFMFEHEGVTGEITIVF